MGSEPALARVGATLSRKYRLGELLGEGGMAAVYRGTHRNGNRVAIKILHPELSSRPGLRERFLREGYVANRVEHPGAVRVLDDDVAEDGSVYLVMELLEGETLQTRWERAGQRLDPREVTEHAAALLDVLAAAHEVGVVHRDIKPENLFVTRDGVLRVLDFGIARLREAATELASVTRTGQVLGTPAFMPPEQVLGRTREIDGRTDVWAVGATMFSLITGQYVHPGETAEEMLVYAGSRPARTIRSVSPGVPPSLAHVIDRALEFEKTRRWMTARDMRTALEAGYAVTYLKTLPPPFSPRPISESMMAFAQTDLGPHAPQAPQPPPPPRRQPSHVQQPGGGVSSLSTTAGVESGPIGPPLTSLHPRPITMLAAGGALLLGAAVLGAFAIGRPTNDRANDRANERPAVATAAPPAAVAPPSVSDVAPSTAAPTASARPAMPPGPKPTAAKPAAPRQPGRCTPPYSIDALGRRIPKPECL